MTPYQRLAANTKEPDNGQACWEGTERKRCRYGYIRANFYIPGLGKTVSLTAHLALWVAAESGAQTADELYLAYVEFRCSGLELDHRCTNPPCRNPDHLKPETKSRNNQLKYERRRTSQIAGQPALI